MKECFTHLMNQTTECEARIGELPFNCLYDDVLAFGASQYQKRVARIEKARGKSLEELYAVGNELITEDHAS
jgi:hypothetical protein